MTIYFDHFFEDGTSMQVGSAEKIVLNTSTLDTYTSLETVTGEMEVRVNATTGMSGKVSVFGWRNRDGATPPIMTAVPALNIQQYSTIVAALVHMFGGGVIISGTELMVARERKLEIAQIQDPYMMKLNTYEERQ